MNPLFKGMRPKGGPITGGTAISIKGAWFKYMP